MYPEAILLYSIIFLFGIVIGSFCNVCILRMPKHETVVTERSHCMRCGYPLAWYDMVPVASWLFLRGRCRKCKEPISPQYPIVEAANGFLYVMVFAVRGFTLTSVLYCLLTSALLVLSVIDWRTYEIPIAVNGFVLALGILRVITDYTNWLSYLAGFLCVSMLLLVILLISKGKAIGGGDVKLMAAAGLLLGWKNILLGFLLGCILGSIIHLLRMKLQNAGRTLAMGPYLSLGIWIAALYGDAMIGWYLSML